MARFTGWDTTIVPFPRRAPQPRQYVAIRADISERKRAEAAQARLAEIVNSSEDAILSKTPEGIITSRNLGAQKLFGYAAGEAIGQPVTMLFPPDRLGEETEILARILRGEVVRPFETVRRREDGSFGRPAPSPFRPSPIPRAGSWALPKSPVTSPTGNGLREKTAWLASFPEQVPNAIVELDLGRGAIQLSQSLGMRAFPGPAGEALGTSLFGGLSALYAAGQPTADRPGRRELVLGGTLLRPDRHGHPGKWPDQNLQHRHH
jgi:PAS domain S-box-containing protein